MLGDWFWLGVLLGVCRTLRDLAKDELDDLNDVR